MNKIRIFMGQVSEKVTKIYGNFVLHINFLKENNIAIAMDFFEVGMLGECKNRLKIASILWPNDKYIKYLLSIVYLICREREKGIKLLKTINDYENTRVKKLIKMLEKDKILKVINEYEKTLNLQMVENEIDKMQI